MANQLEKFYSKFGGIDTRSNKLLQDPSTFRKGSKNFRYDFQDQIIKAQGFQHKDSSAPNFVDIFEYKYRDVNTGAALTQILGVATDGFLYRKLDSTLTFNFHGAATSVSVIYDEIDLTFKMVLAGVGEIVITDVMTLADLKSSIDALLGVGSVSISGSSSKLAYLLDCVVNDTSFAANTVYYWEKVPFPDSSSYPFPTTYDFYNDSNYEGISSVNLNNCIYITDGGFPMKYDGKSVHRAGVPSIKYLKTGTIGYGISGVIATSGTTTNTPLPYGSYSYKLQFGFKDQDGAIYLGQITNDAFHVSSSVPPGYSFSIQNYGYQYGHDFPVYGCKVSSFNSITKTITVSGSHNILPGQCVMQPVFINTTSQGERTTGNLIYYYYAYVDSVTPTTITLNTYDSTYDTGIAISGGSGSDGAITFTTNTKLTSSKQYTNITINAGVTIDLNGFALFYSGTLTNNGSIKNTAFIQNQSVMAYWVPDDKKNTRDNDFNNGISPYGSFLRIYRTKVSQNNTGPWYYVSDVPLSYDNTISIIQDNFPDINLSIQQIDMDQGQEIPRACKYLSQWQGQLVQSGRPVDATLRNGIYPSIISAVPFTPWPYVQERLYTEALLCDFQSVYYADALTPEGFPQDGVHEISIDTKFADKVKGIYPNKDGLFAFKERSTALLTGSLATNDINMEVLEVDCGCVSHKSIKEIRGMLIWLDKVNGFFACVAGRLPTNVGFSIQDWQKINELNLDYSKAAAANFRKESLYVCSVGTYSFVFDFADNGSLKRDCWYIWDRINGKSLLATSDDKLLIWDGTRTWKMKVTHSKYDYSDHKSAYTMLLNTAWMSHGEPSIDKHYVGMWMNSIQGGFSLNVKQYGNYLEDQIGIQNNINFIPESSSKKFVKAQVKACIPKLSSISFGMENSELNEYVILQGYEIQYSADFNIGEPKR